MNSPRIAVQIALAILSSVSACAVITLGRFDDPRWLANGWTQLMGLGALWFLTSRLLSVAARWGSERFKACCLYSAALHIAMAATLKQVGLQAPHSLEDPPPIAEKDLFNDQEWLAEVLMPEVALPEETSPLDRPTDTDAAQQQIAQEMSAQWSSELFQQRITDQSDAPLPLPSVEFPFLPPDETPLPSRQLTPDSLRSRQVIAADVEVSAIPIPPAQITAPQPDAPRQVTAPSREMPRLALAPPDLVPSALADVLEPLKNRANATVEQPLAGKPMREPLRLAKSSTTANAVANSPTPSIVQAQGAQAAPAPQLESYRSNAATAIRRPQAPLARQQTSSAEMIADAFRTEDRPALTRSSPGLSAPQPRRPPTAKQLPHAAATASIRPPRPIDLDEFGLAEIAAVVPQTGRNTPSLARPRPRPDSLPRQAYAPATIIDAEDGPGGLLDDLAELFGQPGPTPLPQNAVVHTSPLPLQRKELTGAAAEPVLRAPSQAFAGRKRRRDEAAAFPNSQKPLTEAAIERGLIYITQLQQPNGRWQLAPPQVPNTASPDDGQDPRPSIEADAAATGLALLSYLGAGYDHLEGNYQEPVNNGLQYLMSIQRESGEIFPEAQKRSAAVTRFYSHGIATLALCEAYGMTGDPQIRDRAQRALDYITESQHPLRHGWRYEPRINSDLSVSGWQLMALRSGELAGLSIPTQTYPRVRQFVDRCRFDGSTGALYCYNPWAPANDPRTRHGRRPGTVMTAVGLLMELYLGSDRDSDVLQRGANHLLEHLPAASDGLPTATTSTPTNPNRDTYYWYYATQVMFHMGGDYWKAWNGQLHSLLVDSQLREGPLAGSWDPYRPVPDKWAPYAGRLYVTAMNLLSLEVYYRHLPLYEMAAK